MQTYEIRYGSDIPFIVRDDRRKKKLTIIRLDPTEQPNLAYHRRGRDLWRYAETVGVFSYDNIFVPGEVGDPENELGNTILVQLDRNDNRYLYVGNQVYEFIIDNPIIDYESFIDEYGYPEPYALTEDGETLLMEERFIIPTDDWNDFNDPYEYFNETDADNIDYIHITRMLSRGGGQDINV